MLTRERRGYVRFGRGEPARSFETALGHDSESARRRLERVAAKRCDR